MHSGLLIKRQNVSLDKSHKCLGIKNTLQNKHFLEK